MANTEATTSDVRPKAAAPAMTAMAAIAPVLGWLVPGAGHLVQRRWIRGLLLMMSVLAMFELGLAMNGKIYQPNTGDLLDILGFIGDVGSGGLYFLGRIIDILAEELEIPYDAGGSTTHKREDLAKGLEPDQCYYIRNEPLIRGRMELDLTHDPPPDLAIEIDISRSSVTRLGIYAALGVPEVWRYDGEALQVQFVERGSGAGVVATGDVVARLLLQGADVVLALAQVVAALLALPRITRLLGLD